MSKSKSDSEPSRPAGSGERDGPSFEQALEQVEAIIERIESGEIGLEASLAEYERGIGLIGVCRERLRHAQQRVVDLTQKLAQADKSSAE